MPGWSTGWSTQGGGVVDWRTKLRIRSSKFTKYYFQKEKSFSFQSQMRNNKMFTVLFYIIYIHDTLNGLQGVGGGKHVFVPLSLNKLHKFICICTVQWALDGWKSARCMKWTGLTFNKGGKACCTVHASRLCKAKRAGTSMNQSLPGSFYSGMPLTPLCWASCLPRLGVVSSTRTGSRWSTPRS